MRIAGVRALVIAIAISALTACAPAEAEQTPPPEVDPASETPQEATPEPAPRVFAAASTCSDMLGPILEGDILDGGYLLFSSTPGAGVHYPIESTQSSGSPLSCWYGVDGVDLSTFEIAAQAIRDRASVESSLSGFASTTDGDTTTWVQEGTSGGAPAIVHVVRPDSWLTGYSAYGGAPQVATLTGYLTTVADNLYE